MVVRAWVVALTVLTACGDKDPPIPPAWKFSLKLMVPSELKQPEYQQASDGLRQLVGWELSVGGKLTGQRLDDHQDVTFEVPSSASLAEATQSLALVGKTPCGDWTIPIAPPPGPSLDSPIRRAKEPAAEKREMARSQGSRHISLFAKFQAPEMKSVKVYVDWGSATEPVRIGALEIPRGTQTLSIPLKAGCGAEHPVTVGGATVGTWSAATEVTLISADAKVCHYESSIAYGQAMGGPRKHLGAGGVHALVRSPDYFLKPAPKSLSRHRDTKFEYVLEVGRADCPADGSAAPAAK